MTNTTTTLLPPFYAESNSTLAVTSISANVAVGYVGDVLLLQNDGYSTCYVALGIDSTVTATAGGTTTAANTGSMPILAGSTILIRVIPNLGYVAAITDGSNTTTLRISRGTGV